MTTIATPTITKQANGSFAENPNEINNHQTTASSYAPIRKDAFTKNNKNKAHNPVIK